MNILIDGRTFSLQSKGGVSSLWSRLILEMDKDPNKSVRVVVYPAWRDNIHLAGIMPSLTKTEFIELDIPSSDNTNYYTKAAAEQRRETVKARLDGPVHIQLNTYYGESLLPTSQAPYIVVAHDFAHRDLAIFAERPTTAHVIRLQDEAFQAANGIIPISIFTRSRLLHYLRPKGVVRTIHHGNDVKTYDVERKKRLCFIGARGLYKNFDAVYRNQDLIARLGLELLVLGGETPDDEFLKAAERIKVTHRANLTDDEIGAELAGSQFYLSTSLYEGFGLPLLQALAFGVTPVITDIPPYREIAGDQALYFGGDTGRRFADALQMIADGHDLGERAAVSRPWSSVYREYASFFEDVSALWSAGQC